MCKTKYINGKTKKYKMPCLIYFQEKIKPAIKYIKKTARRDQEKKTEIKHNNDRPIIPETNIKGIKWRNLTGIYFVNFIG
jgi:hypothetical protein